MFYAWSDDKIRLFGRWDRTKSEAALSVNTGSTIEFRFSGTDAVLRFDTRSNVKPHPHVWIEVDGGAMAEAPVTEHMHIRAKADGEHSVRVIFKSANEMQHRWYAPVQAGIYLFGVEADALLPLPEDARPIIEYIGDSITEGILIEPERHGLTIGPGWPQDAADRVYQDDVCLDYSWLVAEALNCRARVIGFGAVGTTHAGSGSVPKAAVSYPQAVDGVPAEEEKADVIVINHGANDRGATPEVYAAEYRGLLEVVRDRNPDCPILCMSAFVGAHPEALRRMIDAFNLETGDDVHYVDATGWVPPEPLHPLADGHRVIAEKLLPVVRALLEEKV